MAEYFSLSFTWVNLKSSNPYIVIVSTIELWIIKQEKEESLQLAIFLKFLIVSDGEQPFAVISSINLIAPTFSTHLFYSHHTGSAGFTFVDLVKFVASFNFCPVIQVIASGSTGRALYSGDKGC